ncbi:hypothetical protein [Bacillus swezeyi]|uniref:Uncharacterized protein n=1 Tax=Bacillus swezeyi TaxID=1925020 RepID=A0A5M8RHQ9_9BACI|nr:hypothetical protein [Bacillus swezeyi]KAA6446920.1 hypothetical protein DX927_22985 [Bacillus swezeyi]KAA6471488.1 hypothetical protein DX928_23225 [Bacillus swezeyi]
MSYLIFIDVVVIFVRLFQVYRIDAAIIVIIILKHNQTGVELCMTQQRANIEYERSEIESPETIPVKEEGTSKTASWDHIILSGRSGIHFVLYKVKLALFNERLDTNPHYATVSFELSYDGYEADSRNISRLKPPKLDFCFLNENKAKLWSFNQLNLGIGNSWYEIYASCGDDKELRSHEKGVNRDIFTNTAFAKPIVEGSGFVYFCEAH